MFKMCRCYDENLRLGKRALPILETLKTVQLFPAPFWNISDIVIFQFMSPLKAFHPQLH
jgi:hypothetical protein